MSYYCFPLSNQLEAPKINTKQSEETKSDFLGNLRNGNCYEEKECLACAIMYGELNLCILRIFIKADWTYLAHWPEYFIVAEAPGRELNDYIMGNAEGSAVREECHGHVTALTVAPKFDRLGLAAKLMELLEEISERKGGFLLISS
uniref:N-alpha-acetyltransferase 20 n=1 Tax=Mus spicilegus TaxID=10103 RepID=A0A8C6GPD2_MUSSI